MNLYPPPPPANTHTDEVTGLYCVCECAVQYLTYERMYFVNKCGGGEGSL